MPVATYVVPLVHHAVGTSATVAVALLELAQTV